MVYSYASRSSSYARSAYNEDMVNRRQRKQRQLQQEQFDETPAKEDQEKENEEAAEVAQQQMAEMNLDRLAKEKASSSSAARSSPPVELPPTFYTIAKKIEPALREGKRTVELVTNVWPVEAEDRLVYRYDVSLGIEIVGDNAAGDQTRRIVSMNKGAMDDAAYIERAEFCRLVLLHALESYGVLREMGAIAHDGAATIYSNANLDTVLKPHHWTLDVRVTDLPEAAKKLIRNKNAQNIVIEIQRCREGSQYFNIKDLHAAINTDKSNVDSSLKQFYEVVTSAYGISKTSDFTLYRGGKLYEHKKNGSPNPATRDIGTGHERVPGLMKGVTFVEGTDAADRRKQSRAVAALVLDSTVATFFKQLDLVASLCELNGWRYPKQAVWTGDVIRRTNEFLKNVRVVFSPPGGIATFDFIAGSLVTVRDESGRERIEKLENLRERDATGREIMTISKFNGRNILFKDWPCLTRLHGKKDKKTGKYEKEAETYFPLEFLSIAPHQRVPLAKQLAEPEAAERPGARMRKIMAGMEALNLHNGGRSNPWMEAFGIHISIRPLTVTGIRRATPHLQFGGQRGVAQISDDKVNWRTGDKQFIEGGHIDELIIFFNDATNEDEMYRLFKEIQRAAGMKRLTIKEGSAIRVNQEDIMKEMCNIFEARKQEEQKCKREKRIVLLYVDPLHIKSHSPLKLFERRYLIVTQHLTLEVAKKLLRNDRSTMENVLLKLNMKAGGTNYEVQAEKFAHKTWLRNSKTMVIGIDVAHATNLSQHERMRQEHQNPSSIGFSFNGHKRADRFIGDYHFTFTNKEIVDSRVLNSRIKWMLEVFKRERGFLPDHILITRDGVSEGQHQYLLDELDALREGAAEFGNMIKKEYKPRLTFVLATKRHNHRFLQEARGRNGESTFTNAPPGTVVDTVVTRPEMTSFFLQAHYPLQGTAKSTAYRVIADDYGYKMDELQAFVNALCFEHQVSTGAISIPAPIYQADEWAKRGYDNFKYYRQLGLKLALTTEGLIDTEEMTKRLAYWRTRLELVRSNA